MGQAGQQPRSDSEHQNPQDGSNKQWYGNWGQWGQWHNKWRPRIPKGPRPAPWHSDKKMRPANPEALDYRTFQWATWNYQSDGYCKLKYSLTRGLFYLTHLGDVARQLEVVIVPQHPHQGPNPSCRQVTGPPFLLVSWSVRGPGIYPPQKIKHHNK